MDRSWLWSALMGLGVVACLQEDKPGDSAEDDDEDDEDTDGPAELSDYFEEDPEDGDGAQGADGCGVKQNELEALAQSVCEMYDDCGIMEYYFGDMSTCVDTVQSYYESYGCTPSSTYEECIAEIEAGGCDYYYYGGSGACYYALECSGGYYYYYYYYSYYY